MSGIELLDFYPLKGTFRPGESTRFQLIVQSDTRSVVHVRLTVWRLARIIATVAHQVVLESGEKCFVIAWQPLGDERCGYGITVDLLDALGQPVGQATTAFDVLDQWTDFPRYGFLTDFSPGRNDIGRTIDALVRYHVNGLQFYDWQFRHDSLMPPTSEYVDPLGRKLSLESVREFIKMAHAHGMAAMAYLAIYAASLEFWHAHGEWALYDGEGTKLDFMGFLGLMDPTADQPWSKHLLQACAATLAGLPFDGLHVDQYGEPKLAYDAAGSPVDIPDAFASFIRALKEAHPGQAITFNAVGNWPIEALATAPLDFVYIEIWPPETRYLDVAEIVLNARRLSEGKAVVVALYLPADRPANILLANALIYSCGGSRIELGEEQRLLADPYFPKHQSLSDELGRTLRRYADFVVRYSELIGPSAGHVFEGKVSAPAGIWHQVRRSFGRVTLCLVNFLSVEEAGWDEAHPEPTPQKDVSISASFLEDSGAVKRVMWAAPNRSDPSLLPCEWRAEAGMVQVVVPYIAYWAIVTFEFTDD